MILWTVSDNDDPPGVLGGEVSLPALLFPSEGNIGRLGYDDPPVHLSGGLGNDDPPVHLSDGLGCPSICSASPASAARTSPSASAGVWPLRFRLAWRLMLGLSGSD